MVTLQDVINAFAESAEAGRAMLAKLSVEQLTSMRSEAQTAFGTIQSQAAWSASDVDAAEQITTAAEGIDAQLAVHAEEAAATAQRISDLAGRVNNGDAGADQGADQNAGGDTTTTTDAAGGDAGAAGDQNAGGDTAAGTDIAGDGTTTIAASGAPTGTPPAPRTAVDLSKLRSVTPVRNAGGSDDDPIRLPEGVLMAAADVPGMASGASYASIAQLAEAAVRRLRSMPNGPWTGKRHNQVGLAYIRKEFPEELVASGGKEDNLRLVEYAASEARLKSDRGAGSLIAAGGWCAPSETVYDVWEVETRDGMLSAPEILLSRGGIEFSQGPLFSEIYTSVGFAQTEAQAIANTAKTCFEVPCPDFDEVRLDLLGVCINAGILQNKAFPEFVQRYLRGALTAHAHKINASKIDRMQTAATDVSYMASARFADLGAFAALIEAIDMQARDTRTRHRMMRNATLEVVLPYWVTGVIRSDLINRSGDRGYIEMTDEQIQALLRVPNVAIQFVYDYQDSLTGGAAMGAADPITEWPDQVEFLMYSAGTFVFGMNDIITLDTGIYDFPNLTTNKYNALFTEEGLGLVMRGQDARQVTVPLCPSGRTGASAEIACDVNS